MSDSRPSCAALKGALRLLSKKQLQHHLRRELGIDWPNDSSKTKCSNEIIRLVSQSAAKLQLTWRSIGKRINKLGLQGIARNVGLECDAGQTKAALLDGLNNLDAGTLGRLSQDASSVAAKPQLRFFKLIQKRIKQQTARRSPGLAGRSSGSLGEEPHPAPRQRQSSAIKAAVQSILRVQGFGESLASVRHLASQATGFDCVGDHKCRRVCDIAISRAIKRKNEAAMPKRALPVFSKE